MSGVNLKIKAIRARSGLTQDQFAAALNEKPSKIRDIESGRQRVNDQFATKLVENFPVDLNWLFSGDRSDVERPPIAPPDGNKPFPGDVRIRDQEYAAVRVFDVDAAAGNGFIPVSEAASDQIAFTRSWLLRNNIAADLAGLVRVRGNSMAPTIPDRAFVLVDFRGKADWSTPGIYVIRTDDAIVLKRLELPEDRAENWVAMVSDNPEFPPVFIKDADTAGFQPIARVRAVLNLV